MTEAQFNEARAIGRLLAEHGIILSSDWNLYDERDAAQARSLLRDYNLLPKSPCFHVWHWQRGTLSEPDGIRWKCGFCPAIFVKRRANLLDELIRAELGADTPLVDQATAPAPRSTPSTAP